MPIDYKEYHPKWRLISYLVRFARAKNRCEWCGARNHEPHPITGSMVVLTVAHIDHDKTNNRFSNLAALCQCCHLNHDREQHIANRRYGRKYRGKHQLSLALNRVTTATTLVLVGAPLPCRRGSSSIPAPIFGFSATPAEGKEWFGGENEVFTVKSVFSKLGFVVLQLLQITIFYVKIQYSTTLQSVTRAQKKGNLVTFVLQSCNIL